MPASASGPTLRTPAPISPNSDRAPRTMVDPCRIVATKSRPLGTSSTGWDAATAAAGATTVAGGSGIRRGDEPVAAPMGRRRRSVPGRPRRCGRRARAGAHAAPRPDRGRGRTGVSVESEPPADCTTTRASPSSRASIGRDSSTACTRSSRTCRCWRKSTPWRSSTWPPPTRKREKRQLTQLTPAMTARNEGRARARAMNGWARPARTGRRRRRARRPWSRRLATNDVAEAERGQEAVEDLGRRVAEDREEHDATPQQRRQGVKPLPLPRGLAEPGRSQAGSLRLAAGGEPAAQGLGLGDGEPGQRATALGRGGVDLARGDAVRPHAADRTGCRRTGAGRRGR